jgi:hypothetical protein
MVSFEQVVARIGQLPVGDASAMRSYARRVQAQADAITQQAHAVTAALDSARYQSPAATRLRANAGNVQARLVRAASRLSRLAEDVLLAAGRVEQAQHGWHAEFARVARELERELSER